MPAPRARFWRRDSTSARLSFPGNDPDITDNQLVQVEIDLADLRLNEGQAGKRRKLLLSGLPGKPPAIWRRPALRKGQTRPDLMA